MSCPFCRDTPCTCRTVARLITKTELTPSELEIANKVWKGNPPDECKGKCDIVDGFMYAGCKGCAWSEEPSAGYGDY
jgi:hypothetical protein